MEQLLINKHNTLRKLISFLLVGALAFCTLYNGLLLAKPSNQNQAVKSRYISAKGQALIRDLAALKFERLGHPAIRWDSIPPVKAGIDRPHQLLVALVRFKDIAFTRFTGSVQAEQKLRDYYQELLFDPSYKRVNTLSHYFAQQSYKQYHLQGQVLKPITLDHSRAHYGRPKRPEGGSWRNDNDAEGLVEEVLSKLYQNNPDLFPQLEKYVLY